MAARGHGKAAKVAELVDVLGFRCQWGAARVRVSSLSFRTINITTI